jgi:hypothetical protein
MPRTPRNALGLAAAAAATIAVIGGGTGAAASAESHHSVARTPTLSITASKTGFQLSGPRTFRAGRVNLTLKAVGGDRTVQVASFKKGFTFTKLRAALLAFGEGQGQTGESKAGLTALNDAVAHTYLYGGLDADSATARGSVVLARPGTYVIYDDSGNLPTRPRTVTVIGPEVKRASPHSTATVVATSAKRFGGAKILPARGTITFANRSNNSPHMLSLQHVKTGTTRKQVIDFLSTGQQGNPPWGLQGSANTDIVGDGLSQTLTYHLQKGEYIEMCFFPDLQTGMPHALMGMVGIVTLK